MLRKTTIWLLAIVAALSLGVPATATADEPRRMQRLYLALGDSLAFGVRADSPQPFGYVPRLLPFFAQPRNGNVDAVVNLGIGGETSGTFIQNGQLARAVAVIADPASDVRVVTLDIGGNDLLNLLGPGQPCAVGAVDPLADSCSAAAGMAVASFPARFELILSTLQKALGKDPGHERVLVMTYYNPFSGSGLTNWDLAVTRAMLGTDGTLTACPSRPADAAGDLRLGMNDWIVCTGTRLGATVVDVYPLFRGRGPELTGIATGDPHPNDAGYEVIRRAFEAAATPPSAR
jgi:lysophospholipase L1-like esterase